MIAISLVCCLLLLTFPLSFAFLSSRPFHVCSFAGQHLFVNPSVGFDRDRIVSQIQSEIQDIDASITVIGDNIEQANDLNEKRKEAKAILGIVLYCISDL